ncbi:MAG: cell division protein FtsZ [Rhodospirillaceae bacterium]|nr:cell division protein FtsZ [Rhodospirillaceae bacterium]OUU25455.1 MAG: cell division protein FtsZ [Candidatus Endolissoclinum sp. TMED37]
MTINFSTPHDDIEMKPRITVVGVGGAGGNAVNNMIQSNLEGVEFIATNTDSQALGQSLAGRRLQLGNTVTQGLGAGSRPDVGKAAAEEAIEELLVELEDSNMVFITAGMGGGTGTGAAPVIAQAARERGILTVGVVTKPFHFEGAHRMRLADQGIEELTKYVDTLIIIPNQNLFRIANEKTTFADAFHMADNVLHQGVRGVTDLMVMPGLINLDFADIRTVMSEMGKAMMGTGEASGDKRAIDAAESAIKNPLLDDISMKGARGVLINITGGMDMTLFEVDEAANRIREEVDVDANIIFGSTFDEKLDGLMRVSVVATGIAAENSDAKPKPQMTLVSSQKDPMSGTFATDQTESEESEAVQQKLVPDQETENSQELASLKRTGTFDDTVEFNSAAMTSPTLGAASVKNELTTSKKVKTAEVKAQTSLDVDSEVNAPDQEVFKTTGEVASKIFVPPAPEIADIKKDKLSIQPDPFNAAAVLNTGGEIASKKSLNLFQRVTGIGKRGKELNNKTGGGHDEQNHLVQDQNNGLSDDATAKNNTSERITETAESSKKSIDDSALDIPAFLRR